MKTTYWTIALKKHLFYSLLSSVPLAIVFYLLGWTWLQIIGAVTLAVAFSFLSVWVFSYQLVQPLQRLLQKTQNLVESPFREISDDHSDVDMGDSIGWQELDSYIDRLGQNLREKTIGLSREKTELRALMSSMAEAVLAVNSNLEVLFFNPQLSLALGANTKENQKLSEIVRSPDLVEAYRKVLTTGQIQKIDLVIESSLHRVPRTFQVSIAPLTRKPDHEIYGAVGVFSNITELKQAEKIRIDFVANVSHELRTPLTSIHGYLQTALNDIEQGRMSDVPQFLGVVQKNVERLKGLVENLLDLSSLESGSDLKAEWLLAMEFTERVIDEVPHQNHEIHLKSDVAEVFADPNYLHQVLRNLIENAVRYVPAQGRIDVSWTMRGDTTILSVKDNGPGIAPEHQGRLFERFYRVDPHRSREVGGTGIGLAIVKHVMQRHGGSVHLQSEMGKGAEFVCEFPNPQNS